VLKNPEKKVANFGKSQKLPQRPNSMFFEVLSDGESPNSPVNRRKKFKNLECLDLKLIVSNGTLNPIFGYLE